MFGSKKDSGVPCKHMHGSLFFSRKCDSCQGSNVYGKSKTRLNTPIDSKRYQTASQKNRVKWAEKFDVLTLSDLTDIDEEDISSESDGSMSPMSTPGRPKPILKHRVNCTIIIHDD